MIVRPRERARRCSWPAWRRHSARTARSSSSSSFEHLPIDLFIASPGRGVHRDYSHWLERLLALAGKPAARRRRCPSHLSFRDGRIVANGGAAIATPEERDVFAAPELPWVEPAERAAGGGADEAGRRHPGARRHSTTIGWCLYAARAARTRHGATAGTRRIASAFACQAQQALDRLLDRHPAIDVIAIESPVARFAKALIPQARVSGALLAVAAAGTACR